MRLAGERGGEGANLSMCSRLQGLYKARVSDLLEPAKTAREQAAAFRPAPRRHGDRGERRGRGEPSCGARSPRRSDAARGRRLGCSASVDSPGSGLTSPLRALCSPSRSSAGFWRPWVDARGKKEEETPNHAAEAMSSGPGMIAGSGKRSQFRHPVRLFWPKSKCYDYLYQEAEALLKNFPIQATISFYEDSDSEDEIAELTCEN
ncbi:Protein ripply2 [Plecturocebus cupreus]